ncbi:hypothetical protein [Kocuria marina]|uniref:hypothetical protein n=1 Tax=Kocuria marina TaxID=223184 RepID=UPI0011A1067B|nr:MULTISPECIES: hypothetical protein [Kocuria]MCT2020432.1 hypothetical protein [Kocuria marina]
MSTVALVAVLGFVLFVVLVVVLVVGVVLTVSLRRQRPPASDPAPALDGRVVRGAPPADR